MSCFYVVYNEKGPNGEQLALEIAQEDKYHPKKTGVYNVDLQPFMGNLPAKNDKEHHKKAQQWMYNASALALESKLFPGKVMFEGANKNLIVYTQRNLKI